MPTPILYAPNGQPVAFELSGDEKRTELLCVAFGLLSGTMAKSGELAARDEQLGGQGAFLSVYCTEIVNVVGLAAIQERFPGLKVHQAPSPETVPTGPCPCGHEACEGTHAGDWKPPPRILRDLGALMKKPSGRPPGETVDNIHSSPRPSGTSRQRAFPGPRLVETEEPEA
jgi:hypothetical protein